MSRLGDKIHQERIRRKMGTKEVAKKCGISESFLLEVEAGRKIINDQTASRILKVIGSSASIIDEFEEPQEKVETVKTKTVPENAGNRVYVPPAVPNDQWKDALSSIIKRVPVYNRDMKVIAYKVLPVEDGKIEGYQPEKVFFMESGDNSLSGFRIRKGDWIFIVPVHEIVNNAIMLLEYKSDRIIRRVKRLDGSRLLLISHDREVETETVEARDVAVLGRCTRVEFALQ